MSRERNEPCSTAGGSEPVPRWAALDMNKKGRREPRRTGTSAAQTHHSLGRGSVFCRATALSQPTAEATPTGLRRGTVCVVVSPGEDGEKRLKKMPPSWLGGERLAAISLHQSLVITRS